MSCHVMALFPQPFVADRSISIQQLRAFSKIGVETSALKYSFKYSIVAKNSAKNHSVLAHTAKKRH